jgi:DNA-binding transcriptional regulator YhcF (GntR family)
VATGAWREGERVPSSEDLAELLGVNRNTTRGAYVRLARAGTLIGEGGVGTSVAIGAKSSALLAEVAREHLAEAVGLMWSIGVPRALLEDTVRAVIVERYEAQEKQEGEDV